MMIHRDEKFSIHFGDIHNYSVNQKLPKAQRGYGTFAQDLKLNNLIILNQTHGINGHVIHQKLSDEVQQKLFETEGDWLITNQSKIGLGVLTADCLPVAIYDPIQQVVAIAHAGWKGTVAEIVPTVLAAMQEQYGTQPGDIKVYFGPSARTCCYEITAEFLDNIDHVPYKKELIINRDNKLYFDVPLYNKKQLLLSGVKEENISNKYNMCTMCNHQFHSYRRLQALSLRQATIIFLQ